MLSFPAHADETDILRVRLGEIKAQREAAFHLHERGALMMENAKLKDALLAAEQAEVKKKIEEMEKAGKKK